MQSSSPPDTPEGKTSFRRPSSDAANRKYRRRSPTNGSSSSDGSPKHDHSVSPIISRDNPAKVSEHQQRRKDDERELDRDSGRSHHRGGPGGDSYKHSDHQLSRNSHNYSRHNDHVRNVKHANDEDRNHEKLSFRYGQESRDHSRSKDYLSGAEKSSCDGFDVTGHKRKDKNESLYLDCRKYKDKDSSDRAGTGRKQTSLNSREFDRDWHKQDRDGRDEKKDYRRSSGRNDRTVTYEEFGGRRNESSSGRDCGGYHPKEPHRSDPRQLDGQKLANEGKKKNDDDDDDDTNRDKNRYCRADKSDFTSEKQETPTKRQKFSNWDKGAENLKDAAGKMSLSSMQALDIGATEALSQVHSNDSVANDLDAAKVAAMRAAELVNKNLVGVGYMSTDQKKKLLWGSKKSTAGEESGPKWDATLFDDRDRQEKFNKLMSLRLPWWIWPIVGCEGRRKGRSETKQSRQQRSPSGREAEGTTPVRFGEAIHCWTSKERWPHSWIRSLSIKSASRSTHSSMFSDILLYSCSIIKFVVFLCLNGLLWNSDFCPEIKNVVPTLLPHFSDELRKFRICVGLEKIC